MTKVSVVTVCYNSAQTVKDTLQSVASQKYQQLEYVIVDGKSPDSTIEIIAEQRPNLPQNTVVLSEKDSGLYDAMNKGWQRATGDVVGFLNSDDVFASPDAVSKIAETFEKTGADIVYGNIVYTKQNDLSQVTRSWRSGQLPSSGMRLGWHPPHPAFYVRRELLERFGGFKLKFRIAADYEMMVRLIQKHHLKTAWCDHTIVRMREGGSSNAGLKAIWKANKECWNAWLDNELKPSPLLIPCKLASKVLQYRTKL
jgi:glycosyltransferase involved in cell wall biosynthesis